MIVLDEQDTHLKARASVGHCARRQRWYENATYCSGHQTLQHQWHCAHRQTSRAKAPPCFHRGDSDTQLIDGPFSGDDLSSSLLWYLRTAARQSP